MSLLQTSVSAILKHFNGLSARIVFQYSILTFVQLLYFIPNIFDVADNLTSISLSVSICIPVLVLLSVFFIDNKKIVFCKFDYIVLTIGCCIFLRYIFQKDFYLLNDKFLLSLNLILYYFLLRTEQPNSKAVYYSLLSVYVLNLILAYNAYIDIFRFPIWGQSNSGIYSIYISSFIPLLLFLIKRRSYSLLVRIFVGFLAFLGIILIIYLDSRTSWISLTAGMLSLMFFLFHISDRRKYLVFSVSVVVVITCILYFYKKNSSDGRLFIYKNTMEMIKDRPFLGHGFDSFKVKYLDYQATYFKDNSKDKRNIYLADNTRTAFNDYMLIIAEQGIFAGVLIFIAIFLLLKKTMLVMWNLQVA